MDVVDAPLADMQFDDRGQSMFQEAQNDGPLGSEGHGYHGATAPIAQDIGGHRIGADGHLGPWNVRRPGHGGGEHSQETIQIAVGSTSTTSRFPPSGWVFPRPLQRFYRVPRRSLPAPGGDRSRLLRLRCGSGVGALGPPRSRLGPTSHRPALGRPGHDFARPGRSCGQRLLLTRGGGVGILTRGGRGGVVAESVVTFVIWEDCGYGLGFLY
jgi:hypothetical protein